MSRINRALTPEEKADARAAIALLEGTEISLIEAARRAVKGQRALRRAEFSTAVDEFVLSRIHGGLRRSSVDWYDERLRPLVDSFGARIFDTINRADLKEQLESTFPTLPSRAAAARACRALWRWAMRAEPAIAGADITIGLQFKATSNRATMVKVLTVAQCQAGLTGAGSHTAALAAMLFAGVRPEEVAGPQKDWLKWEHIGADEKIIRIPAEINKTGRKRGQARVIEGLPPTLWKWLKPGELSKAVAPCSARSIVQAFAKRAGFRYRGEPPEASPWPQDALRHTFATYALALTKDPGQVALWLGHEGNPRMLYVHYRGERTAAGPVTEAMAKKFFALRPAKAPASA